LKISAFLFAALIFFVSFFYQEKKESRVLSNRLKTLRSKCLIQIFYLYQGI
jgi:hypothetical protein